MKKIKPISKKIAGLDGFRFLAFVLVLLCHTLPKSSPEQAEWLQFLLNSFQLNGIIGMQFFFFLSAFLLTYLSLKRGLSQFNLFRFLRNRALRILPLYLVILFIGFILYPLVCKLLEQTYHLPPLAYFLTFTQNFYFDAGETNKFIVFFLLITWSIAVEVQFYFLLGLALKFLKKNTLLFGAILIGTGVLYNLVGQTSHQGHYFSTFTYFPDFGAGVIFAHYWFKKKKFIVKNEVKPWYPFAFFSLFVLLFCWNSVFKHTPILFLNNLLFPFVFCLLVFHQMHPKINYFKPAQVAWVEKLGEISYGLYLYHGLFITLLIFIANQFNFSILTGTGSYFSPILVFSLSVICSYFSYQRFELPFLKKK